MTTHDGELPPGQLGAFLHAFQPVMFIHVAARHELEAAPVIHNPNTNRVAIILKLHMNDGRKCVANAVLDRLARNPKKLFFQPRRASAWLSGNCEFEPHVRFRGGLFPDMAKRCYEIGALKCRRSKSPNGSTRFADVLLDLPSHSAQLLSERVQLLHAIRERLELQGYSH
jgi:hypothetical protein